MKFIKELPLSIFQSCRLATIPLKKLHHLRQEELPVVISITSIPSRFKTLHLVIRSLLVQTYRPKKILLWLNEDLKSTIPQNILKLQSDVFEVHFSDLNCSHRKLIHSLERCPDDIIVTCDDDLIYRKNWLELIYQAHRRHPEHIIGNRTKYITYDANGKVLHYRDWRYPENGEIDYNAVVAIGAWGILYPPKSLDERVTDVALFNKLTPNNDDLWFKALALLKGTGTMQAEILPKEPIPLIGSQKEALKTINIKNDQNIVQWLALSDYFGLDTILLNRDKSS